MFLTIGAINKNINSKRKFSKNHGHSILRPFVTLPDFLFTTSETNPDY